MAPRPLRRQRDADRARRHLVPAGIADRARDDGTALLHHPPCGAGERTADGEGRGARLAFRLNTGDLVTAGPDHALRFAAGADGPRPYLHVRGGMEALVARTVYYELAERAIAADGEVAGLWSDGAFFALEPAA